ncbi:MULTISPECIES: hypothetical protein [unclassified Mameliella]|uniref:hypothetical protein n=1 Tax=unclassified Mameliella TaxID=2630630 RepID=UPI00273EFADF|nr:MULTISPECIES: hypothetical protein [unclassified Mameliella]
MVDSARFTRKMRAMETEVHDKLTRAIERWADRVVAEMRAMLALSYPAVAAKVDISWTWGQAPAGAITVGQVGRNEFDQMVVTVYAKAKSGSGISAAWFEFGTAPRVQKKTGRPTGRISGASFFFGTYRSNRRRILSGLRSTLRRAVRNINAL